MSMIDSFDTSSTRPYLIRALYEWCTDNGLTPYVAVRVDESVQVPREYVKDGEIVLNVSMDATSSLKLGNEFIEFKARFAGTAREIMVPIDRVLAIYARESGQGMSFPTVSSAPAVPTDTGSVGLLAVADSTAEIGGLDGDVPGAGIGEPQPPRPTSGGRPSLKRVK